MIKIIKATNEPVKSYEPGSIERLSLQKKYDDAIRIEINN